MAVRESVENESAEAVSGALETALGSVAVLQAKFPVRTPPIAFPGSMYARIVPLVAPKFRVSVAGSSVQKNVGLHTELTHPMKWSVLFVPARRSRPLDVCPQTVPVNASSAQVAGAGIVTSWARSRSICDC